MKVAIIGSGGREHALCFSLEKSEIVKKIYCIPGNAGTSKIAENIEIDTGNFNELANFIKEKQIEIVLIGPEKPLVDGIVDVVPQDLRHALGSRLTKRQKSLPVSPLKCRHSRILHLRLRKG